MGKETQPFACTHTPEVPDILRSLRCTLALSTYQAGKVIFLSAGAEGLIQLPRSFARPMGMAVKENLLAVAARHEVVVLANAPGLARSYPNKPGVYDGFYAPRAVYYTGALDLHDMAWVDEQLWAVNTRFSCLALIDHRYSFLPQWRPRFITELSADDRCHLNGLALEHGKPLYLTALGETNEPGGWRENKLSGGVLMHMPSSEIVVHGLSMPHSPRIYDGTLYLLNSASGELLAVDPEQGRWEVVTRMPGFLRGMSRCGDYLFIGVSKIRKKHQFSDMPVAKQETFAGIILVHLPSGAVAGTIRYLTACEEIYDVHVLPGLLRPGILNHTTEMHRRALATPTDVFWRVEEEETGDDSRSSASPTRD